MHAAADLLGPLDLPPALDFKALDFEIGQFRLGEIHRFYVRERTRLCSPYQVLDLWLPAPYCPECTANHLCASFAVPSPDVSPDTWQLDLLIHVGPELLERTERQLFGDRAFAFSCKACSIELRPWNGDEMCIFQEHMEEANGIPTEEESRRKLSKRLRRLIENLYGRKCFGCGAAEDLHMDHIIPQSRGGTSAFRNLQPLCERCGQEKGDSMPEVIEAMSLVYFEPGPPDAGEALFC